MGRISDILPPLYYSGKNDVEKFAKALDVEIDEIERKIKEIPALIDVDLCPDDKLPYLAALTDCPLVGENAILRRRQIRNWPWLLKIKGTEQSLKLYLDSIGATNHRIMTYFRDADGNYVEEKPEGAPFLGEDGLWHNIRTHYFGIEITWEDHVYLRWPEWNEDLVERVSFWMKRMKPFHSELLKWDNLIYEDAAQDITVGTAVFQNPYHEIGFKQATESRADAKITVGAAVFQAPHHAIGFKQATQGDADTALSAGAGVFRSEMRSIVPALKTEGAGSTALGAGAATFGGWNHDIGFRQSKSGKAEVAIGLGAGTFSSAAHSVGLKRTMTHSPDARFSTAAGIFCSKVYEIGMAAL